MRLIEHAKEGLSNLYFAKLRSSLALLGVLVGTASVVAMLLGGELATHEALNQFKSLGTDLLAVSLNDINDDENKIGLEKSENLSVTEAIQLAKADQQILNVAPYTQLFSQIVYNGETLNGIILGVTGSFADVVKIKLKTGRFISLFDNYAFYCVIGNDIYTAIKKISHQEPLGQQLQIGKNLFVIVGIADTLPENNFVYANIDNAILIPLLASTLLSKYISINNIIMQLKTNANIPHVEKHVTDFINQFISNKQINFRSAKELIAKMEKQSNILTVFLGLIGSVALLVGGIGVMNIMLVSVMERRREIGIRLAVGAKRFDIAQLFLLEAIMLSIIGGLLGIVIGISIAYIIAWASHWEFVLFFWPIIAGFSVSFFVGIFFGFYPAYCAAKLNPIDALRSE